MLPPVVSRSICGCAAGSTYEKKKYSRPSHLKLLASTAAAGTGPGLRVLGGAAPGCGCAGASKPISGTPRAISYITYADTSALPGWGC